MSQERVFVDTWGWLALGHRRDLHHAEIKKFYQGLCDRGAGIFTSDYVLDEVITLLFQREPFSEAVRFAEGIFAATATGHLVVERVSSDRFASAWKLRKQFHDKPRISFTDFTSMAIMEEQNISQVLTQDRHFLQVEKGFSTVPVVSL